MVDGIRSPSVSMISTTGLANADLSWKMVTKGVRSATRRPRKINRSLNISPQHNEVGFKDEPSVAESEEFGVAVLGHRFSEKIDHLPIKKRRPMQQSLPRPARIQDSGELDGLLPVRTSSRKEKYVSNKSPLCSEDSYGIQLLAAAACNTIINDEVLNVKAEEKIALPQWDASVDAPLIEETIKCSQKENSLLKDVKIEAYHDSKEQNNSPIVSMEVHEKSDAEAGKDSSSGKDVRLHWDLNTVMDEWELFPESFNSNSSRNGSVDETKKLEGSGEQSNREHAWELLKCPSKVEPSAHVMGKSKCTDSGLSPRTDPIYSESSIKEKMNHLSTKMIAEVEENSCQYSDLNLGQTLASEDVQRKKLDYATISEKGMCDVVRVKLLEEKISQLPNDRNNIKLMGTTLDAGDPSSKSVKAGSISKNGEDLVNKRDIHVPLTVGPLGSSSDIEVKKLEFNSGERFDKVASEDLLDDGDVSDYSPTGHHHLVGIGKLPKYQSGWESPVEDGELRESFAHSWQENEDETDCVDYDMNGYCVPEAASDCNHIDSTGKLPSKELSTGNSSGRDRIAEGCEHGAKTKEAYNVKVGETGAFDTSEKFNVNGSMGENVESSVIRGKFSDSRAFGGKVTRGVQRSSGACFQDRQVYRSDKYFDRDRPFSRTHGESQQNNHYQNGYRRGGGNPRLRCNYNSDTNDDELTYDDQRLSRSNNYPKDGNRPFVRRRPPDDSHNSMNNFGTRDDGHFRGRGRSGFYRRGFVKGNRDEFYEPIADDSVPNLNWVSHNHSARRQCSPSPVCNRENSFSRLGRKSRSRSRSRSPVPWHLQRERNGGTRRNSRSPDFRSEGRMGRNRMHYNSKFAENDNRHISPSRRGFFNDRNSGPTRFRERTSPGRFCGQRPRFGSNGTGGRMKADDGGFRPRINSERFSEQTGGGWRGYNNNNNNNGHNKDNNDNNNYDGSDGERTRYNNKHEMIRRVRHNEAGGGVRRFRSDADDCCKDHYVRDEYSNNNNRYFRSNEKSDALGKSSEGEREKLKYDGDRTNNTSSKLPGVLDTEDVAKIS